MCVCACVYVCVCVIEMQVNVICLRLVARLPPYAYWEQHVIHYVAFMYVLDDRGMVVGMSSKLPDDPAPATMVD